MLRDINKIYRKNAEKNNIFSGKRFLGYTPNKKEVWITVKYLRDTRELSLWVNTGFYLLYEEDADLAQTRLSVKSYDKTPKDVERSLIANKKNAGGKVTVRTLDYIERLLFAVNMKDSIAYVDGQPSSLLFSEVAWIVFTGDLDEKTGFRWRDVVDVWKLPRAGYFTISSFPKYSNE